MYYIKIKLTQNIKIMKLLETIEIQEKYGKIAREICKSKKLVDADWAKLEKLGKDMDLETNNLEAFEPATKHRVEMFVGRYKVRPNKRNYWEYQFTWDIWYNAEGEMLAVRFYKSIFRGPCSRELIDGKFWDGRKDQSRLEGAKDAFTSMKKSKNVLVKNVGRKPVDRDEDGKIMSYERVGIS